MDIKYKLAEHKPMDLGESMEFYEWGFNDTILGNMSDRKLDNLTKWHV